MQHPPQSLSSEEQGWGRRDAQCYGGRVGKDWEGCGQEGRPSHKSCNALPAGVKGRSVWVGSSPAGFKSGPRVAVFHPQTATTSDFHPLTAREGCLPASQPWCDRSNTITGAWAMLSLLRLNCPGWDGLWRAMARLLGLCGPMTWLNPPWPIQELRPSSARWKPSVPAPPGPAQEG